MQQKKRKTRALALLLASLVFIGTASVSASAAHVSVSPPSVTHTDVSRYEEIPIYLEGYESNALYGRLIRSTTYVPLRAAFAALMPSASLTYTKKSRTADILGEGLSFSASDGAHVVYANGRCLYTDMPVRILSDGVMYLPVRILEKVLSLLVSWDGEVRSVTLSGDIVPILDGASYYKEDEVYWLSRIISAESRGEPFIGQVAVGNVVMNRMRHKDFPNTIWGVIFDRRYGVVQFSPVSDGTVWDTPHKTSVIAAKVVLEGYTVSDDILFFYAPSMVSYTWIAQNRPYAFTIAGHRFYN